MAAFSPWTKVCIGAAATVMAVSVVTAWTTLRSRKTYKPSKTQFGHWLWISILLVLLFGETEVFFGVAAMWPHGLVFDIVKWAWIVITVCALALLFVSLTTPSHKSKSK